MSDPSLGRVWVAASGVALTLAPGESTTCTATHTVTQADVDAGSVINTATAAGTDPGGNPVTDPSDPVTVPAVQTPVLETVKSSTTVNTAPGDVIDYSITVTNTGNVTVDAVDVSDPNADPGSIVCVPVTPLTLAPGESTTCTATHTVTQADVDAGSVINTATVAGTDPAGNPVTDPSDPVTVPAVQTPVLETVKSSTTVNYAAPGDVIDYSITVTNTGNVTVDAVDVSDPNADPGSISCVPVTPLTLAPGESTTCTATHTVTQADVDAGSVIDTATARHRSRWEPGDGPVGSGDGAGGADPGVGDGEVVVDGELCGAG